ncbi:ATP-binding protein [Oscillatoriales cyanobacterium LEGE 11467]|uniref:ATP-binding protein n=1 Tax=Zarconia navalis LEGE 11467 TaxID=1828826 RepID=A0A928VZT2_9CYAN|nr:ATP-binding protein [Zarconia navalis]MBE9040685.1 ATP-binding protein [Zarconia navalis LEGE 11467]
MSQIFGYFDEDLPETHEYIVVGFSPSSVPIRQRWRNNGLSADFLSDYLMSFFPEDGEFLSPDRSPSEIKDAISYIANELLENAMKFNYKALSHPVSIQLRLLPDRVIFLTTNAIEPKTINDFQDFLKKLIDSDLEKLYVNQIEQSVVCENKMSSQLGFLTMALDYMAKLGWKFERMKDNPELTQVTTMVTLEI